MAKRTTADEALVTEVARAMLDLVVEVEPDQAPARMIFPQQARGYLADPAKALAGGDGGSSGGGALTFGPTGVEALLVPVLMQAAADVVTYLGGKALLHGATVSTLRIRRLFGLRPAPAIAAAEDTDDDVTLTPAQWAAVAEIVEAVLIRYAKMPKGRAARLAAAVVGEGVLRGHRG